MPDVVNESQMREKLRQYVSGFPTQVAAAESLSITPPYLSDLLAGKRNISPKMAEKLGYSHVFTPKE